MTAVNHRCFDAPGDGGATGAAAAADFNAEGRPRCWWLRLLLTWGRLGEARTESVYVIFHFYLFIWLFISLKRGDGLSAEEWQQNWAWIGLQCKGLDIGADGHRRRPLLTLGRGSRYHRGRVGSGGGVRTERWRRRPHHEMGVMSAICGIWWHEVHSRHLTRLMNVSSTSAPANFHTLCGMLYYTLCETLHHIWWQFHKFCDALYHCFCGIVLLYCIGVLSYINQLVTGARHMQVVAKMESSQISEEVRYFMSGFCQIPRM